MRLAWSARALLAVLRRWAGFLVVGAGVLGVGYFVSAIGWPALPVLWASSLTAPASWAVLIAHASIATVLAWRLREALLPAHWLLAERALPLTVAQRTRADLAVVAMAQSPLLLLYAASLLSWRHVDPHWLRGQWPRGLGFMAGSVVLSLASAVALLALRRRQGRVASREELDELEELEELDERRLPAGQQCKLQAKHRMRAWTALLALPLWRGPARPVAALIALTTAALVALLAGAAAGAVELRWALAGYALVALAGCSQTQAQALRCFAPLIEASRSLPLAAPGWALRLRGLAMLPVLLSGPLLLALLLSEPQRLSPWIASAYLLAAGVAPLLQFIAPSLQAEARAARWLLALAVWVALATEILHR